MKQNIRNILKKEVNEEVSRHDIVELFYGKYSNLYRDFHDKLLWSHTKLLMFVKTCGKLSEFNFTTTHAYSTTGMMDGMMDKGEFIACFEQIHKASSIKYQLTTAREDSTLWKECRHSFNSIAQ